MNKQWKGEAAVAAASRATTLQRAWAFVLAALLCVGLLPQVSWATPVETTAGDGADAAAVEPAAEQVVTLTVTTGSKAIYDENWNQTGTEYPTWVNKQYTLAYVASVAQAEGGTGHVFDALTMEDLLNAAVEAGDLKGYDASESQYGKFLNAITSKDGAVLQGSTTPDGSTSLYWSLYDNGGYAQSSFDATKLVAGNSYQFAWAGSTTATAPDDWKAFYQESPADKAQSAGDVITLTLTAGSKTIYDENWKPTGTEYPTWVNKQYTVAEVEAAAQAQGGTGHDAGNLTMQDLLDAAVAAGDLKDYDASKSSYGGLSLNSITSKDGATLAIWNNADFSVSLYWAAYDDGNYSSFSFDQVKLAAGKSYQLAWTGYTTASAPADAAAWAAFYQKNPADSATDEPIVKPTEPVNPPKGDEHEAVGVSVDDLGALMENIAASYAGTTDPWQVMDLAAAGRLTDAERAAFVPAAIAEMENPDPSGQMTVFQRSIIGLSAAGADAAALPNGDTTYDAVSKMAAKAAASSPINLLAFTLLAYESGDYDVPAGAALSQTALVRAILDAQLPDGGFSFGGSTADADMTAMVIAALATQADDNAEAKNAMNRALTALKGLQNDDGGFGASGKGAIADTNANSTAMAVIALAACGIDPATEWATESGATPLSALLTQATGDRAGFVYGGTEANENATEQGFRALVAYQGFKNTGAAYNIYTQAKDGQATFAYEPKDDERGAGAGAGNGQPAGTTQGGALAATSDAGAAAAATASVLVLGALATAVLAARRSRVRDAMDAR